MKQLLAKKLAIAALAVCTVPNSLFAQQEKEKEKTKEKTERQQIVITRTGDKEEKTVIEIQGDKVKVNGKDVADLKDVQVHVNNLKLPNGFTFSTPGSFSMNWDSKDANSAWFKVDSNRAMLGVVTEGSDKGVEIQSITKESGADKAGLKKGDIITKIDSRKIDAADDVTDAIRAHKPGDKVAITFLREGKEQKSTAELGRWKGMTGVQGFATPKVWSQNDMLNNNLNNRIFERTVPGTAYAVGASRPKLGLSVQDTDDGKGAKVLEADEEGNAAKAGIKEGDIITQVDDKAVNGADEISKLIKEKKDQPSFRLQILRNGKPQTVDVKIPRRLKTVDL